MGLHGDTATDYASRAANFQGEGKLTDAVGEGLAAVTHALLEVADAIRENTAAQQEK
ncbi:hypothetical protein [Streptomyces sp. H27-D2]|uniref:hypothetical protein n=1 Tax=Streptomyces sp. H27-D2 TaxID=3046304 RepID=UPI002DB7C8D3|nr:hypothetical protein [Streptomyces sp. H27-D2]MEC4019382.1 hypothetical protein [Streptomyces sp. H27-D2]